MILIVVVFLLWSKASFFTLADFAFISTWWNRHDIKTKLNSSRENSIATGSAHPCVHDASGCIYHSTDDSIALSILIYCSGKLYHIQMCMVCYILQYLILNWLHHWYLHLQMLKYCTFELNISMQDLFVVACFFRACLTHWLLALWAHPGYS